VKPSLIIVEPKAHRRLVLVAALSDAFSVTPLPSMDGALRQIRTDRPVIVLIGVGRRTGPCLRLCRQIKTDAGSVSCVGLIDWGPSLTSPENAIQESHCDGVFIGIPNDEQSLAFASELNKNSPTIHRSSRSKGFLRFLKR